MTRVYILTELGEIIVEVFESQAPRTSSHFLKYVDEGYYNGATFYRTVRSADNQPQNKVKIDVIEGGYYNEYYDQALKVDMVEGKPYDESKGRLGPHPRIMLEPTSETGIKHLDGTVTLGRTTPEMVDDSLVICIGDQPELDAGGRRHEDGLGFPAFGRVVEGMDLVRCIYGMNAEGQKLIPEVKIFSMVREIEKIK
ncbi:MAG: peptidylprolyl isomerase [Dehalobacterium sp.]